MKQLNIAYGDRKQMQEELHRIKQFVDASMSYYFQILSAMQDTSVVQEVVDFLHENFPQSVCIANSTAGNIRNCDEGGQIQIIANAFEYSTTKYKILQYEFDDDDMSGIASDIKNKAGQCDWLKAVEIYHTVPRMSTSFLCDELSDLDNQIQMFGGIVCSTNIESSDSFIYSDEFGFSSNGILCIFLGGEDLHVDAIKISGWKPIGRTFRVTKAKGNVLYQLSGVAAYEIYKKYLNIQNDENFFMNALDFPLMFEHNGSTIFRASAASNNDGSIRLSANVEEGSIVRLSYGEPRTIIQIIQEKSEMIKAFQPEVMHIFSCAARKAFWSTRTPTYEIKALRCISDSMGFFSHGEFLREKGMVNQHNLTLVVASFREGEKKEHYSYELQQNDEEITSSKIPLAARMATFIRETSYELEQINSRLEVMNQQLKGVATTDALTGLGNRLVFNDILNAIDT